MFMRMIYDDKLAQVSADELRGMLDEPEVRVLDVRRATEFARGHLPGAINIAHTRLADRLDEVPGDKHLLVNCRTGQRSSRAGAFLQRMGYEVTNLEGGILAWDLVRPGAER